jgi:dTDP-4-amino-4,6-dideoxygalactose transaminase
MEEHPKKIVLAQPALPKLEDFLPSLEQIWTSRWLTNKGPFHERFEKELADYLGVKHICLFTNGTLALVTALQALKITGEVLTTPYSFVATSHSLWWNTIRPVFVDIHPTNLSLDPAKIESAITPNTTAILAVHVYGVPSLCSQIQRIADIYGLRVIYDAAHAFGVKQDGVSILEQGDLSILSFHATKVFHTFEGGAIVCPDLRTKKRIDYLKNFGFADEVTVVAPGINGKMNEFSAALGLVQLKNHHAVVAKRMAVDVIYRSMLADVPGLRCLEIPRDVQHNGAYFPIFIENIPGGTGRDELYALLKREGVIGRRYFYPLISEFPTYKGLPSANPENLPVATRISREVICLPIHQDMTDADAVRVCTIIHHNRMHS